MCTKRAQGREKLTFYVIFVLLLLPWFINNIGNDLTGGSIVRASLCLVSPHVSSQLPIVRNNSWGLMLLFTQRRFNLAENESSSDDQGFSIVCLCVLFIWCFLGEIYVLLSFGTYLSHALVKSQVDKFQTRLWLRFTREDSIFVIFLRSDPSSQIFSDFQCLCWPDRGYHAVMGQHDLFSFIGSGAGHLWSSEKHPPDTAGQGCFVMTLTNVAMIHGVTGSSCQKYQHNSL